MLEALCRQSSTTLDIVHAEDGPPIIQRTSGLGGLVYWAENHQPDRSLRTHGHVRAYKRCREIPNAASALVRWVQQATTAQSSRKLFLPSYCTQIEPRVQIQAPLARLGIGVTERGDFGRGTA